MQSDLTGPPNAWQTRRQQMQRNHPTPAVRQPSPAKYIYIYPHPSPITLSSETRSVVWVIVIVADIVDHAADLVHDGAQPPTIRRDAIAGGTKVEHLDPVSVSPRIL